MQPIYFVEIQHPRLGRWFLEVDRDSNSRAFVVNGIREKQFDPIKILEVDEDAGSARDVTTELCEEAADGTEQTIIDRCVASFDHAHDLRKHSEAV